MKAHEAETEQIHPEVPMTDVDNVCRSLRGDLIREAATGKNEQVPRGAFKLELFGWTRVLPYFRIYVCFLSFSDPSFISPYRVVHRFL